jgi:hypothetical protein
MPVAEKQRARSERRLRAIAPLSLIFTYLFFLEYLPPFTRVHIPYDLQGFHYPLTDYAFHAIRHGRFPEWDPSIYCGLSFVGNIQVALFYPPTWILFAANLGRPAVSYQSLEDFVLAHVWLAFLLCYIWLRRKSLAELASILGAGVFAYSGYMLNQLQHLGLVAGWAWIPLALSGIDEAVEQQYWRPLWKVVVASALCFLAGYPPTWVVFAICTVSYAAWRWKTALGVMVALGASLLLAGVQLLPASEATRMKAFDARYGAGWRNPEAYIAYFLPNYFNFGLHHQPGGHWGGDYLYLGAPAFLGLLALAWRPKWRELFPALTVLTACVVMATNPFGLVWKIIRHSNLLVQICRDWYFLAGLTLATVPLAAFGLDHLLKQKRRVVPGWAVLLIISLMIAWSIRELLAWFPPGSDFPTGWKSAIAPAVTLLLFSLGIFILPGQARHLKTALVTALLFMSAVDYKVFGTSKWFDASEGSGRAKVDSFPGVDDAVFRQLRASPEYRIALDDLGPYSLELRHYGLMTPQGFDPLITTNYQKLMAGTEHIESGTQIDIDPENEQALGLLGVRFFMTAEASPTYPRLSKDPDFRLLQPATSYYKTFEFVKARPPYSWVPNNSQSYVRRVRWQPEAREFIVRSDAGGQFALSEQFYPGWTATVDGSPARIERWNESFQAIQVPAGEHRLVFRFRSFGLRMGTLISLLTTIVLAIVIRKSSSSKAGVDV